MKIRDIYNMNCTLKYVTSVIGKVIEKLLNHTRII